MFYVFFFTHELQTYVKVPFEKMHIYRDKRYSIYICLDFPLRHLSIFTARKRSLGQACVKNSVHRGGGGGVWFPGCLLPGCACSGGGGGSRPTDKGGIQGDQVQAHTQGGNCGRSGPGPIPKGEIEEDQIQAHTQGGNSGGSGPTPPPR